MGPRNTHLIPHKNYCWLGGGNLVSSRSSDDSEMVHSKRDRFSNPLYQRQNDNFSIAGDVRGGVGPKTTQFYPPKCDFGRGMHNGGFLSYQSHHIAYPME